MRRPRARTDRAVLALLAGAITVVGILLLSGSRSRNAEGEVVRATRPGPRAQETTPPQVAPVSDLPIVGVTAPSAQAFIEATRDQYAETAAFPPWSRHATAAYARHTRWNDPIEELASPFGTDARGEVHFSFTMDKMSYQPGERAVGTLRGWRGAPGDRQAPIDFDARLVLQTFDDGRYQRESTPSNPYGAGWKTVLETPVQPTGELNTARARFVPSAAIARGGGIEEGARVSAIVTLRGPGEPVVRPISMQIEVSLAEPIVILGKRGERIENGSLAIDFDVEVVRVAPVNVQATLWTADGKTPIAVYDGPFAAPDTFQPASTGRQVMTVVFFGLVLHEAGVDGPYRVSGLHGSLVVDEAPGRLPWRDDREWTTGAYRAAQFSDAEWESQFKTEMLQMYDSLASDYAPR